MVDAKHETSSRRSFLTTTARFGLGVVAVGSAGGCNSVQHRKKQGDDEELQRLEKFASEETFRDAEPTVSMKTAELRQYVSTVEECGRLSDTALRSRKARRILQLQTETIRALNSWDGERFEVNARFTSIFACGCHSRIDTCCKF